MEKKDSKKLLRLAAYGAIALVCCVLVCRTLRNHLEEAAQAALTQDGAAYNDASSGYSGELPGGVSESPASPALPAAAEEAAAPGELQGVAAQVPEASAAVPAASESNAPPTAPPAAEKQPAVAEDGSYDSAAEVALYIHLYKKLPRNYISKKEAGALGWQGGSLEDFAPGKSIGGDRFGNREGLLPQKKGRSYTECDIGTKGKKSRGAKRIVFSNDGLIYYTDDHYQTFTLLYGTE